MLRIIRREYIPDHNNVTKQGYASKVEIEDKDATMINKK